ncbi:hypothetical protein EYC84_010957 [Monilinia fructicola]|uniref:Uncharacterized protein n=1 Tax=Monilinia fructicola TaxID=38448 RepID=A0A5M9JDC6_MONFR|nr:hypothetical protein EYC84_010957 [Monilinia fructicola]
MYCFTWERNLALRIMYIARISHTRAPHSNRSSSMSARVISFHLPASYPHPHIPVSKCPTKLNVWDMTQCCVHGSKYIQKVSGLLSFFSHLCHPIYPCLNI